jgi:hypothetical protein
MKVEIVTERIRGMVFFRKVQVGSFVYEFDRREGRRTVEIGE